MMTKVGMRRLLFLARPGHVEMHGMSAISRMAYRGRIASAIVVVLACFMLDGCATVKKLVPWRHSNNEAIATPQSHDDAKASADNGAVIASSPENRDGSSTSESKSPKPSSSIDLSVPRVQRDQAAIADQPKSQPAAATQSGKDTAARASSFSQSEGSTNDTSAGADEWGSVVQEAIHRRWVQPLGPKIPTEFSCDVMVKLTPFGGVDDVKIVRSCGDVALDASIETAVRDSSPLPIPKDPADFSDTLLLTFTPR